MSYIQAMTEEFKKLRIDFDEGKISKYEVANLVVDLGALIRAKKVNVEALKESLEVENDPIEQAVIRMEIITQQKEQLALEKAARSFSDGLAGLLKKKNNIVHF